MLGTYQRPEYSLSNLQSNKATKLKKKRISHWHYFSSTFCPASYLLLTLCLSNSLPLLSLLWRVEGPIVSSGCWHLARVCFFRPITLLIASPHIKIQTHFLEISQESCVYKVFSKALPLIHYHAPAQNQGFLLPLNSCRSYIKNSVNPESTASCSDVGISGSSGLSQFLFEFLPTSTGFTRSQLSVQFSSVAQSCPTLCSPMNCSMPGLPVHHQLVSFNKYQIELCILLA